MIDRTNIHELFSILDKKLKDEGITQEFTIFGSGSLIIQGIARKDRSTIDIDLVEPEMDTTLQSIAGEIGEEFGMDLTWLNSAGRILSRSFPEAWQKRSIEIFKGEAIIVKSLGRKDIIATKFNAYCTRHTQVDKDDLIDLKPNKLELELELEFSRTWILSLKKPPDKDFVDLCFKEVLEQSRSIERGR